ncbi:hypothetical protein NL676_001186 [Syzygium grande]|nr:hypothetical protein NL676_001186 [Syzygium grande]
MLDGVSKELAFFVFLCSSVPSKSPLQKISPICLFRKTKLLSLLLMDADQLTPSIGQSAVFKERDADGCPAESFKKESKLWLRKRRHRM